MFLGANNVNPYDKQGLKVLYYNMMLNDWKLSFLTNGYDLSDQVLSFLDIAQYFSIQEQAYNSKWIKQHDTAQLGQA